MICYVCNWLVGGGLDLFLSATPYCVCLFVYFFFCILLARRVTHTLKSPRTVYLVTNLRSVVDHTDHTRVTVIMQYIF